MDEFILGGIYKNEEIVYIDNFTFYRRIGLLNRMFFGTWSNCRGEDSWGRKGSNMLYLSGVQSEKVLTNDMIEKVVSEVEKKASELDNSKWYQ